MSEEVRTEEEMSREIRTEEEMRTAIIEYGRKYTPHIINLFFKAHGFEKISNIPKEKYNEFINRIELCDTYFYDYQENDVLFLDSYKEARKNADLLLIAHVKEEFGEL